MTRKTKIIATVGPSIHSKEAINEIIDAGANVLRLNFSHGSNDEYKSIVQDNLRRKEFAVNVIYRARNKAF